MEITGKIIAVLPMATGEGKNGQWRSQDYVLETAEQYPKKVCFNLYGDKIAQYPISMGDEVTVSFDIDSREYNNRWYTSVKAWKVAVVASAAPFVSAAQPHPADVAPPTTGDSDLPF